jgi:hypothetical protein
MIHLGNRERAWTMALIGLLAGTKIGTNTGKIFASNDEGDSWYLLADHLPPVYSVSVSVLE